MTTYHSTEQDGFTVKIFGDYDVESPHDPQYDGVVLVLHGGRNYTFPNDARINFGDFEGWSEVAKELAKRHGALLLTPVWVYEHSGIALKAGARTYPFNDQWDSAQVGFAYITQESYRRMTGRKYTGHQSQYAKAAKAIAAEVELYGRWVNGECYGYVIEDENGEVVDSCGGYIGTEAVEDAATEAIKSIREG